MKSYYQIIIAVVLISVGFNKMISAANFIPANNPYILYYGRWDKTDSLQYRHSWSGNYITAVFIGTKIGVRMADSTSYYNIEIDGKLYPILHGDADTVKDYIIAEDLHNAAHTLRISKRNFSFSQIAVFCGLILDDDGKIMPPLPRPTRKMLFIGDSFTASEGNEATELEMIWEDKFPLTNIDLGFAPVTAKHFGAEYQTVCRSGAGMVCDWKSDTSETIPKLFDRTLMAASEPKYDFKSWIPDVIVICLGLNDHSGLKNKTTGEVSDINSLRYRTGYHNFIQTIRKVYPNAKIVAVAAHVDWIQKNVQQVVDEEKESGTKEIYFARFGFFDGGYVANGHPTVATHKKISDEIVKVIEDKNLFAKEK